MVGVGSGGLAGLRWGCLRCQLDILRLMTRGLERCLRGGKSRSSSSRAVCVRARLLVGEGGKCRLVGDVAAGDAEGAGEGDPVGVEGAWAW